MRINVIQGVVLVVVAVVLVYLQTHPPYIVEHQRPIKVAWQNPGEAAPEITLRERRKWDRDSIPEPKDEEVRDRGAYWIGLKEGGSLLWYLDSTRLIAESALVIAGGALLCSLLRTRGAPNASHAERGTAADRGRDSGSS
jgi:hypothetical protein